MFRQKKTLKDRLLGYLARRDHSPRELRQKLSKHADKPEEVTALLEWAHEHDLIKSDEELTATFSRYLNRRLKAHNQIKAALSAKGLPPPARDPEVEIQKAR